MGAKLWRVSIERWDGPLEGGGYAYRIDCVVGSGEAQLPFILRDIAERGIEVVAVEAVATIVDELGELPK